MKIKTKSSSLLLYVGLKVYNMKWNIYDSI